MATAAAPKKQKKLVIVESPSKAKTIGRFLGSGYKVVASVGHVRDLPKSKLGIDVQNDFEPQYIAIRGKGDVIKEMRQEAKKASRVILATDPDREGEAISWHIANLLGIDPSEKCRVTFNEITKETVRDAIRHPRAINMALVDAQQARRILDRLVGYEISPLLWRKIRKGLSAGRVQSAALKLLCDLERRIQAFVPEEYWTVTASFPEGKGFDAKLVRKNGKACRIRNEKEKDETLAILAQNPYLIASIHKNPEDFDRPKAPYTTSTLQQDASSRLNFPTKKTMQIAQQLYEGVDIPGSGTVGLITYLRTDSVRIADEAKKAAYSYIAENYGEAFAKSRSYRGKNKYAQDAHEAIRPTDVRRTPKDLEKSLSRDQYKMYKLIWERFVASQMSDARYETVNVTIANGPFDLEAKGSRLLFAGYRKVWTEDKKKDVILPELAEGQELHPTDVTGEQKFTQPPARFTEASLVQKLEKEGIGRPSTYAPTITTLTERRYVKREKKVLYPTELGLIVNDMMEKYFMDIVDTGFTKEVEDKLDQVEEVGSDWKQVLRDFYGPFRKELDKADAEIERVQFEDRPAGVDCEICGRPMVIKTGRFGEFMACSGYPECKNTKPIVKTIGVKCPKCGRDILEKRSRRGKIFYGCSGYPECDQSYWDQPVNKACPRCGSLLVIKKTRGGESLSCSNQDCGYREKMEER